MRRNTPGAELENRMAADEASRNKRMYHDIGMNPEQVKKYESQWKKAQNDFRKNNTNRSNMNAFERTENQDKIMKEVLDDSQFVRYQQWVRENPYDSNKYGKTNQNQRRNQNLRD